ncbi:hypothetical protein ISS07_03300 [Candidatus Woesearchaeota archaeon]|nr:hypothetical protein [Candidatus Woesearchaeota archaeon]
MDKKKVILTVISLVFVMSLASSFVFAQSIADSFSKISDSFAGFNPGEYYNTSPYIWDAVFLFFIVYAISNAVLATNWEGRGSKVAIAFAALATAGTIVTLNIYGRTLLGDGGPLLLTILALAAGLAVWKMFKGEKNKTLMAVVFLVLYLGLTNAYPFLGDFIDNIPYLGGIISIALVVAFFIAFFGMFGMFGNRDPAEVAYNVGRFSPSRLLGATKRGAAANDDEDQSVLDAEADVDNAEMRTEAQVLQILRGLEKKVAGLSKGLRKGDHKSAPFDQQRFNEISSEWGVLLSELQKLDNYENMEVQLEKNVEKRANKSNKAEAKRIVTLRKRIVDEKNLLEVLKTTIGKILGGIKEGQYRDAEDEIRNARRVVRLLINVNSKQESALKATA